MKRVSFRKYRRQWIAHAPQTLLLRHPRGHTLAKKAGEVIIWRAGRIHGRAIRHVYLVPCESCGCWCIALRRNRRYCSAACRMRLYRQRKRRKVAAPHLQGWPRAERWCIEDYLLERFCGVKLRGPPPAGKGQEGVKIHLLFGGMKRGAYGETLW